MVMAVRFYEYSFCSFYATHGVVKRKRSVCVGMIKRERGVCVGTTKRIGNVACDVVTCTFFMTATVSDKATC